MKMSTWKKGLVPFLAFVLFMVMAGTALAWQYSQLYTDSTLWGRPQGKPWSPYHGTFQADVWNDGGNRRTNPMAYNVFWNPDALDYIRTHGQDVAITFHSFKKSDNGCSSFEILGDVAGTNLPAPQCLLYVRQCWYNGRRTEGRIYSRDASRIGPYSGYWGQVFYKDNNSTGATQKMTVDTYYGSQENWHQTYCIRPGEFMARVCSSSDP